MMVESRDHRLLSFLSLCVFREGGQDAAAAAPPPRYSGCLQVLGNLVLRPLWLLLSPTLFGRRARTLPPQARSAPGLSRYVLLSIRGGGPYTGISAISLGSY